jgi:hypothetical protein
MSRSFTVTHCSALGGIQYYGGVKVAEWVGPRQPRFRKPTRQGRRQMKAEYNVEREREREKGNIASTNSSSWLAISLPNAKRDDGWATANETFWLETVWE